MASAKDIAKAKARELEGGTAPTGSEVSGLGRLGTPGHAMKALGKIGNLSRRSGPGSSETYTLTLSPDNLAGIEELLRSQGATDAEIQELFGSPTPPMGFGSYQQQYDQAVAALDGLTLKFDKKDPSYAFEQLKGILKYRQDAIVQLQRDTAILADPNSDTQARKQAQLSIDQLSKTNLNDDGSAYLAWRDGGGAAGLANIGGRAGEMTPEQAASMVFDHEFSFDPDADEYYVKDELDDLVQEYLDSNPEYKDTPQMRAAIEEALAPQVVQQNELVGERSAEEIVSLWSDPEFLDSIDMRGEEALKESLDYYDDLLANDGRDAVSDAAMHQRTQEAERLRKANVDAALADLDQRGMMGSGAELFAQTQGAAQSMRSQFDAAMEASALQQQRRDQAAEQRAIHGQALQALEDGRAATMAEAIDLATRERAQKMYDIDKSNTDRYSKVADDNQTHIRGVNERNTDREQDANTKNVELLGNETSARNRYLEGKEEKALAIRGHGIESDAQRHLANDLKYEDMQYGQVLDTANQINVATGLDQVQKQIDLSVPEEEEMDWVGIAGDTVSAAGAVAGGIVGGPGGAAAGGAAGNAVGNVVEKVAK